MSNGFSVYHHCQHETRPAKKTLLTLPPPTMLPTCLHLKILMSEGDYGLHIWSGLGTDPHRTLLGQELLLTHPSKEGGVAPKPHDPSCTVARLDVSLFTTSCLTLQPHQKLQLLCPFTYTKTHMVNTAKAQLSLLLGKTSQEKKREKKGTETATQGPV